MEPFNAATSRAITAYEDLGPTQPSTSGASHSQKSQPKSVPARIKLLIADLGLRYRPAAAADLEAHGSALALLAMDLADLPPDRLDRAIAAWVRGERWMPKASELIALCQRHQAEEIDRAADRVSPVSSVAAYCARRNAELASAPNGRRDIEWHVDGIGEPRLRFK